ncbi:MAG: hypothetical protein WCJ58_01825 [bacterium]
MFKSHKLHLPGQILVILLLALSILSIFVVVIATNARKDTIESVQNKQYEQALALAEEELLNAAGGTRGQGCSIPLPDLINNTNYYTCTGLKPDATSQDLMDIKITETQEKNLNEPVQKDSTLKVKLGNGITTGYNQSLEVSWIGNATILFSLDYIDNTGAYKTAKDVANPDVVFGTGATQACFAFTNLTSTTANINIEATKNSCFPDGTKFLALRIKPLMTGNVASASVTISVKASHPENLPNQVKVIIAEAYSTTAGQTDTPKAILELRQPLNDPPMELLDYVLRTQGTVKKE